MNQPVSGLGFTSDCRRILLQTLIEALYAGARSSLPCRVLLVGWSGCRRREFCQEGETGPEACGAKPRGAIRFSGLGSSGGRIRLLHFAPEMASLRVKSDLKIQYSAINTEHYPGPTPNGTTGINTEHYPGPTPNGSLINSGGRSSVSRTGENPNYGLMRGPRETETTRGRLARRSKDSGGP